MNRTGRFVLGAAAVLGAVTALHIRLNQGGFERFWKKLAGAGAPARGELIVGYLPVT
jgi:hypothetical protein